MTCGRHVAVYFAALLLASCAQPAYVPDEIAEVPFDDSLYQEAASNGMPVYRLDPQRSRVFFRVGRAGPMKSAGHDHVVASEDIEGLVLVSDDPAESRADLRIPLQLLVVDSPEYRARFELAPDVSESSINGTTRNMQDKVLESSVHPSAEATARFASAVDEPPMLAVSITVRGTAAEYLVPVELEVDDRGLTVTGSMIVEHGDFGLTPFSAAGGLLRVADQIGIEFELTAERWTTLN